MKLEQLDNCLLQTKKVCLLLAQLDQQLQLMIIEKILSIQMMNLILHTQLKAIPQEINHLESKMLVKAKAKNNQVNWSK